VGVCGGSVDCRTSQLSIDVVDHACAGLIGMHRTLKQCLSPWKCIVAIYQEAWLNHWLPNPVCIWKANGKLCGTSGRAIDKNGTVQTAAHTHFHATLPPHCAGHRLVSSGRATLSLVRVHPADDPTHTLVSLPAAPETSTDGRHPCASNHPDTPADGCTAQSALVSRRDAVPACIFPAHAVHSDSPQQQQLTSGPVGMHRHSCDETKVAV
jgi:hypothetical protein